MAFPELRHWKIPEQPTPPTNCIKTDEDVHKWKTTQGFHDYGLFVGRLNQAVIGKYLPYVPPEGKTNEAIKKTISFLEELKEWIHDIPPQETTQRYGNLAFRDWGKRLEERSETILQSLLPADLHAAIPLVKPYLLLSFGSFSRMDYGTGHELAFALFLCGLELLRFYDCNEETERSLVLVVFEKYLQVVWKLQDVYKLEPAGSHGVWGLDDYCFLPYIWGSGQVQEHLTSRPPDVLGESPLPETTLYNQAINRIHKLKTGQFHENSPQLQSIASSVPTWWKVNQGLFKMYGDEVLGKRVVVQHIPLGGLFEWDVREEEPEDHDVETTPHEENKRNPDLLAAPVPAPFIPTEAAIRASPQSINEPLPGESSSPKRSPLSVTSALPAVRNAAVPPSPHRQGTMPRPKGGRLNAALTATGGTGSNPPSALSPSEIPLSGGGPGLTLPAVGSEKMRATTDDEYSVPSSAAEPDLRKDPEILHPPTSPQNVAKILNANPVDHRSINATPTDEAASQAKLLEAVVSPAVDDKSVVTQSIQPPAAGVSENSTPSKIPASTTETTAVGVAPPPLTTADTTGRAAKAKVAAAGEHGKGCFGLKCVIM